ncbi:hypothetical protein PG994_008647 [Apiospora phragmitis]|uniref:Uncharacterized protein n=1 Tax=Apiospora phragmitis TaxID=2905665 RepID=A0ABR1UH24_9PEZI
MNHLSSAVNDTRSSLSELAAWISLAYAEASSRCQRMPSACLTNRSPLRLALVERLLGAAGHGPHGPNLRF